MWTEDYEKLNNSEKEEFKRLSNLLLSKTFITRDFYDLKESMMKVNPEYRFIERHFELFSGYFFYSGWAVLKDNQYGVVSMENIYEYNRIKMDRFATLMLYTIRLIFEEERERISLRNEIMTTTSQIIHKMITMNIFKKKPSDRDISESLRLLSNHNLIQKISGKWENADARIMILPSILFVLSNEKISRVFDLIGTDEGQNQEEQETETVMDILRGEVEE